MFCIEKSKIVSELRCTNTKVYIDQTTAERKQPLEAHRLYKVQCVCACYKYTHYIYRCICEGVCQRVRAVQELAGGGGNLRHHYNDHLDEELVAGVPECLLGNFVACPPIIQKLQQIQFSLFKFL